MAEITTENDQARGSFYSDKLYDFHEYCIKFPRMKSDRIMEISESIVKFGQQDDIVLLDGLILDGRHLWWACKAAGKTPRFRNFDSTLHPWHYVKIKNLHRRDLTTAQRATLALKDLKIEKQIAKERQMQTRFKNKTELQKNNEKDTVGHPRSPTVTNIKKGRAVDIVAKEWRIAPKSLRKADKISKIADQNPFIKKYWEWAQNDGIPLEEIYRTIRKALDIHNSKRWKSFQDLNNAVKIYEASKSDPDIKEQLEKVEKGEISLDLANQNVNKIESLNKSIRQHSVDNFVKAGKKFEVEKLKNNKKGEEHQNLDVKLSKNIKVLNTSGQDSTELKYICKGCSKATVMAIGHICEKCGYFNFVSRVICDDDMTDGSHKLRDPNLEICENSPDYDLIVKS